MENKILVPLDGTESIGEILLYVKSITPRDETEIVLLNVIPQAGDEASGKTHVDEIQNALVRDNWAVRHETRMGNPVDEIIGRYVLPAVQ